MDTIEQSRTFHRYAVPQQELAGVHMVSYCTSSQNVMYPYQKHMDPSSFLLWLKFFKLKYLDSQEPRRCQKMLGSGDFNPLPGILTLIVFSWKMWPQSEKLVILSEHHQLITAVVHHKFARVNGKSTLPLIKWQTTFHCWTNPQLKRGSSKPTVLWVISFLWSGKPAHLAVNRKLKPSLTCFGTVLSFRPSGKVSPTLQRQDFT